MKNNKWIKNLRIGLSSNKITNEGAKILINAIRNTTTIKKLSLTC